jgi:hypothetical protein
MLSRKMDRERLLSRKMDRDGQIRILHSALPCQPKVDFSIRVSALKLLVAGRLQNQVP